MDTPIDTKKENKRNREDYSLFCFISFTIVHFIKHHKLVPRGGNLEVCFVLNLESVCSWGVRA